MKKSRFTKEQIAFSLRHAEGGTRVRDVCRKMGICEQTFYRWNKYAGVSDAEIRRLKAFERENRKLKQVVADLSLDRQICRTRSREGYRAWSPRRYCQKDTIGVRCERAPGVRCAATCPGQANLAGGCRSLNLQLVRERGQAQAASG